MENRAHALIAGIFALSLIAAAILSVWWFGGKREAVKEYEVVTKQNVSGLNLQGQVRYRGIRVGRVEAIRLDPQDARNILIRISVNEDVPVTRGTIAKLGYQGLTGIAHVLLEETGRDLETLTADAGLPRIAMQASLFEELSEAGGAALKQAREFLASANQVLNAENRARMGKTLANLETSSEHLAATLKQTQAMLSDDRVKRFGGAIANIQDAAGEAKATFSQMRELVPRLTDLAEKLESTVGEVNGDSGGGMAPRLQELTREMTQTSSQLTRTLKLLEDSPQSVLFGAPSAAPGPGEPGFQAPTLQGRP